MLKERIITGLALVSIILCLLFLLPVIYISVAIVIVFAIAAWEWANFAALEQPVERIIYALSFVALALVCIVLLGKKPTLFNLHYLIWLMAIGVLWWMAALYLVLTYPATQSLWKSTVLKALLGYSVLVPAVIALLYIVSLPQGNWLFLYVIGIVIVADVGAYIFGRWLGNAKLAAHVSPGKSWAGFWGGLISVLLIGGVVSYMNSPFHLSITQLIVCTGIAALASVLGDLVESMFKRQRGIKDSSQLLPGHGGFMDRIDSITAAAPVFLFLVLLLQAQA